MTTLDLMKKKIMKIRKVSHRRMREARKGRTRKKIKSKRTWLIVW